MKDLVVFMPQFSGADRMVWEHNFQSFVRHNPDVDIVPFPEKDIKDPFFRKLAERNVSGWRNCDLVVFDFYRQHPDYERYLYVEWDVHCTMSVHKLVDPASKFDVVSRDVIDPLLRPNWEPFLTDLAKVPDEFKPKVIATRPMCGMSFSARALEKMSKPHPLLQMDLYSEIRTGTLARLCGFEPAVYPVHGHALAPDFPLMLSTIKGEGIWHQVKARYFPLSAPKPDCPLIGHWSGLGTANNEEFELCGDGNIRRGGAVKGQWIYNESDFELVLAWSGWGMEWFEVTSDMCHNRMKRIYRTRYQ